METGTGLSEELVNRRRVEIPCRCQWEPCCSQDDGDGRMGGVEVGGPGQGLE